MASASFAKLCLHCDVSSSDPLKNAWEISTTGKCAQLCDRCFSIYESGRFCDTFHRRDVGWSNCQFCCKPIHYFCLVSFSQWLYLDDSWDKLICLECSKFTSFIEQNFSNVMDLANGIKKLEICTLTKCTYAPMFEKVLTAGDVDKSDGSVVIPKKFAEVYLPEVSDPDGITLVMTSLLDGKEWKLRFQFCLKKMYILDDLREYMALNNLKAGDSLTFAQMIPTGKYYIGHKKAIVTTKKPSRKASRGSGKYYIGHKKAIITTKKPSRKASRGSGKK